MSTIEIRRVGITKLPVDAIVNAANSELRFGGGVCGAIFSEAGINDLQKACNKIGYCDTGSAVITPGFNLKAKYIIHAVGPKWIDGRHKEPQLLYRCYRESLRLAIQNECRSIAFPLISSGIYGCPKDMAWRKALQACRDFICDSPDIDIDIIFSVLDGDTLNIGRTMLDSVISDISIGGREEKRYRKQLDFCRRGYHFMRLISRNKSLKAFCKNPYEEPPKNIDGFPEMLTIFVEDANKSGILLSDYGQVIENAKLNMAKVEEPDDAFLDSLNRRQVLACITWHFRRERFSEGSLIQNSIYCGHLLKLFSSFISKCNEKVKVDKINAL